jgi:hypothetical protein
MEIVCEHSVSRHELQIRNLRRSTGVRDFTRLLALSATRKGS